MIKGKILLFANTDWYLYNFRLGLAEKLRDEGWNVILVAPSGPYGDKLGALGFDFIPFNFSTCSTNPFKELSVLWRLHRLYRQQRPTLCHHFTIKCVLYGSLVTCLNREVQIVNAVTGMGHIFTDPGLKARLLRPFVLRLYRFVLGGKRCRVVFQNCEDQDYFVASTLVEKSKAYLIRGSGVDCSKFRPVATIASPEGKVRILFASRMLREKGVFELLEAARTLKGKGFPVEFLFAGDVYPGNPSSLTAKDIAAIKQEGVATYLGQVDDMPALLAQSEIVVLPSYSEGTPRILIEAAAMGKPIVATDIAGCRGLVEDGVNGLLVPIRDADALAAALEKLLCDPSLRQQYGAAGRDIVLGEFDEKIVLDKTFDVYRGLMAARE